MNSREVITKPFALATKSFADTYRDILDMVHVAEGALIAKESVTKANELMAIMPNDFQHSNGF